MHHVTGVDGHLRERRHRQDSEHVCPLLEVTPTPLPCLPPALGLTPRQLLIDPLSVTHIRLHILDFIGMKSYSSHSSVCLLSAYYSELHVAWVFHCFWLLSSIPLNGYTIFIHSFICWRTINCPNVHMVVPFYIPASNVWEFLRPALGMVNTFNSKKKNHCNICITSHLSS